MIGLTEKEYGAYFFLCLFGEVVGDVVDAPGVGPLRAGAAVVGAVPFAIDVVAAENQLSLSGIDSYVEFQDA